MSDLRQDAIARATEEVTIITSVIIRLTKAAMASGEAVAGPELDWLAEQLDRAVAAAESGETTIN
jgi:hypothetical protein